VPSALIALGFARALVAPGGARGEIVQMGAVALVAFVVAALLLYVRLPVYSQGKATYTLGLTPVFGLLAAQGCAFVARSPAARAALYAVLFAWAALVICSYFVVS
jgi:hypothetical protein